MPRYLYVVATSLKDAVALASTTGWDTREEAVDHLDRVKQPPIEELYHPPFKIFTVKMSNMPMLPDSPDGRTSFEE